MDSQITNPNSNLSELQLQLTPSATAIDQAHQLVGWLQQPLQQQKCIATPQLRPSPSHSPIALPSLQGKDPLANNNLNSPDIKRLLGLAGKPIDRQTHVASTNPSGQLAPAFEKTLRLDQQLAIHSGELLFSCDDFHIPGPIDFKWRRIYRSSSEQDFGLGPGWHHPLCERLFIDEQRIIYSTMDGRSITFGLPNIGASCINRCEGLVLQRQGQYSYRIVGFDSASKLFRADGISKHLPLVELRDTLDNTISIDYHEGLPHKIVTSWGRVLECLCEDGQIIEIHNASGPRENTQLLQYLFNDGLLSRAQDQYRACEHYQYQQQRLSSRALASGQCFTYEWHDASQRYRAITANDYRQTLRWQGKTFTANISDSEGRHTHYRFNDRGQATFIRDAEGGEKKYFYDSYGHLCSETDALGNSRYYRCDSSGRPTRISDELGNCTHIRYDSNSQPALIINALGHHWQQRYNKHGLLMSERDPQGNQWLYHYNDRHQLECLEDPEGGKTQLHWNSQFELTQVISPGGLVREYSYDYWGRITSITVAGELFESYQYNDCNRLECTLNASGQKREFTYTSAGDLLSVREYDGFNTEYSFDDQGRKIACRTSDGYELHFCYDGRNRLIEQTSNAGVQTWSYNGNDQISSHCDAQKRQQSYTYDACQRLIEYRDMDLVTYIERDACGRVTRQSTNSGDAIIFHYDALGRLTLTDNGSSSIRYQYDSCGKVSAEHHDTDFGDGHSLNHRYDKRGWRINSSSDDQLVSYLYTPDKQLYGIDVNGESVLRCQWDDSGCDSEWIQGVVKTALSYNPLMQLEQLDSQLIASNQPVSSHSFDNIAPTDRSYLPHLGMVSSQELGSTQLHDQRGNLMNDQQTQVDSAKSSHYQYNGWNQLISSECGDFKTYYRYDPLGRRISKLTSHRKSQISRHTLFKWNGAQLWSEEHDHGQGRELIHYIFHPQRLAPVAMHKNNQLFYYQLNPQQKPLQIIDQKGELVWQAQYLAGGQFNGFAAKPKLSSPWRGASDYYDSETQLLFDGRGYFSPRLEQYIHNI